jgi:hypothetical protein
VFVVRRHSVLAYWFIHHYIYCHTQIIPCFPFDDLFLPARNGGTGAASGDDSRMSSLAAIALEIENSRPKCDQRQKDLSVRCNFFGSKKFKSCSWSSYFVEEGTSKSVLSQATVPTANLDAVPEKASFPTKKLREYLRLFSTERASSADGNGQDDQQIDWVNMAAKLSTKSQIFTARDCYIHYSNVESKDINKGIWGADEDRKLLALANASEV